jgi:hypothetical protein
MDWGDLQELSRVRLKEATALLKLGHFDGAYYPGGLRRGVCDQGVYREGNLTL